MKFEQIPNINQLWDGFVVETLSPSTFSWISNGCAYQLLLQKLISSRCPSCQLPPPKNAILGTIIHKLYELTSKGVLNGFIDMRNKWDELVVNKEIELASKYPTLKNINLNDYDKRNKAIRYCFDLLKNKGARNDSNYSYVVYSEKLLDCSELCLRGVADKIVLINDAVSIVDYKSGHVIDDEGNVKKEYKIQLFLYAAMCEYLRIGKCIDRLSLVDIDGVVYYIDYDKAEINELCEEVKVAISKLNQTILTRRFDDVAKPDISTCCNCSCRHICKYMKDDDANYFHSLSGIVTDIPSQNLYSLKSDDGSFFCISGLEEYGIDEPKGYLNKRMVFLNVAKSSNNADGNAYRVLDNTIIFEQLQ